MLKKIFISLFLAMEIFAQSATLVGTVTDKNGEAVSYATVQVKELNLTAITNGSGKFIIKRIPYGKYRLIISHVAFAVKEVKATIDQKRAEIKITLTRTPVKLGEAVVVGTRTPETEKNFALPVESIGERDLQISLPNSIADALDTKAGVAVARDGAWGTMINVRGLSKQNLVYIVDGARIETSTNIAGGLSLFDLNDVEKAEVIKGGLSTLYGSGATGGVVNIVTKQAHYSENNYFSGQFSSGYETVNKGYSNGLNLFAGGARWKTKISLGSAKASDTKIPDGYLENSSFKNYSYAGNFGYLLSNKLEIRTEFQKYKAEDVGIPGGAAFPPTARATYPEASRQLFNAELLYRKPFATINLLTIRYYNQWIRRVVEIIPAPGKSVKPSSDHRTNGVTLQSEAILGSNFVIAGIDAWQRTYNGIRETRNDAANAKIYDKPVPNSKFASLGFFVNDDIPLAPEFKMTLGGRYDFIRIENDETINPIYKVVNGEIIHAPNPAASFPAQEENNESWSGNLNLIYKAAPKLDFTFSFAKTFRSPSLEERYQYINLGGIIYLGNPALKPEKSISFDFGTRYFGDKFSVKADVFLNNFNDLVIDEAVNPESLYVKNNVGKARYYGFDLSFQIKLCKSLFGGTLSYVNARDTENDVPLPQIPPLNGTLTINAPITDLLNFTLCGTFYADQNDTAPDEKRTPGYAVYALRLQSRSVNLKSTKLRIYAGVENIFDRKYRNHLSTYRGISVAEPGRNFYLKISFNW